MQRVILIKGYLKIFFLSQSLICQEINRKKVKTVTQESVRNRLLEKTNAYRQKNISEATGIPVEIISKFMNGKRELYDSSLQALNDYLDNH